jgi:hypothetical protein
LLLDARRGSVVTMRCKKTPLLALLLAVCACTPLTVESKRAAARGDAAIDGGRGTGAKDSAVATDARPVRSSPTPDAGHSAGNSTPARDAATADASDAASSSEAGTPLDPPDSSTPVPDSGPPVAGAGGAPAAGAPAAGAPAAGAPAPMCLDIGRRCTQRSQCCAPLSCDVTSIGRVCCGETGHSCAFADGRDCCRNLLCINGRCGL